MTIKLNDIWVAREEQHYFTCFGALEEGMFPLSTELFAQSFPRKRFDTKWLDYGVLVSPPNRQHDTWLYVSSGLSNPWDDGAREPEEEEYSGLGFELVIEVPEAADWAVFHVQRMMAYCLLLAYGELGETPAPTYGDLIRLGQPLDFSEDGPLRHLLICKPTQYPDTFHLPSGHVDFYHLLGITDEEYEFGAMKGGEKLMARIEGIKDGRNEGGSGH